MPTRRIRGGRYAFNQYLQNRLQEIDRDIQELERLLNEYSDDQELVQNVTANLRRLFRERNNILNQIS